MKKVTLIIFFMAIMLGFSEAIHAQDKRPSERSFSSQMIDLEKKQSWRKTMIVQLNPDYNSLSAFSETVNKNNSLLNQTLPSQRPMSVPNLKTRTFNPVISQPVMYVSSQPMKLPVRRPAQ